MPSDRRRFLRQLAATAAWPALAPAARAATPAFRSAPDPPRRVNGRRLNGWLAQFDRIGRTATGINRVAYSEADLAGRAFTTALFRESGLVPRVDALGNILARVPGRVPGLAPLVIGSHVDSVTDGGNYDGPVGTFAAIEVARTLAEQRVALRHPLEVVVWQNEEGGTIGSKGFVGELTEADLAKTARSGRTIREGIRILGGDVARIGEAVRRPGEVAGYLELHIEQGGRLEQSGTQIGVVEGIVGLRWLEVTITGTANHAGATPMDQRQDAMLAAARFTVAVHEAITGEPGRQVATVGRLTATPNTTNIIAGQVTLTVDLRDLDLATLDRFEARFRRLGSEIGAATGTKFAFDVLIASRPALSDARCLEFVEQAAAALGASHRRMPSGAGHDAQELSRITPMAMVFVPSVGGISHSPKEYSRPEDIARGADVLLNALLAADASLG